MKRRFAPSSRDRCTSGSYTSSAQPLADELLGDQHQRAFAQVVGAGLEGEPDHADAPLAAREHLGDRVIDVRAVRLHDARVHRQLDVAHLATCTVVARRSFGRHEPPNANPGFR